MPTDDLLLPVYLHLVAIGPTDIANLWRGGT